MFIPKDLITFDGNLQDLWGKSALLAQEDTAYRNTVLSGGIGVLPKFWNACQASIRLNTVFPLSSYRENAAPLRYSTPRKGILFYTGGVKSLASYALLSKQYISFDTMYVNPELLATESRLIGAFGILGAAMGYSEVFIGIEGAPNPLLKRNDPITPLTIEYTPEFWAAWSLYSSSELGSAVTALSRLDLTYFLHKQGLFDSVVSCEQGSLQKRYIKCGDCFKCLCNWLTAVEALKLSVNLPEPTRRCRIALREELERYRAIGEDQFLNMSYFEYLETVWGVTI